MLLKYGYVLVVAFLQSLQGCDVLFAQLHRFLQEPESSLPVRVIYHDEFLFPLFLLDLRHSEVVRLFVFGQKGLALFHVTELYYVQVIHRLQGREVVILLFLGLGNIGQSGLLWEIRRFEVLLVEDEFVGDVFVRVLFDNFVYIFDAGGSREGSCFDFGLQGIANFSLLFENLGPGSFVF